MATGTWIGGASVAQQISTITLGGTWNDSESDVAVTLTDEVGASHTVNVTPSGTDKNTIAAAIQSALDSSTNVEFVKVTWTVDSAVVTGTAKVAGRPFYPACVVTGGSGTETVATSTANSSPHDFNATANWQSGTVASTTGAVYFVSGDDDIIYGLQQTLLHPTTFHVGPGFNGGIGDHDNGYYLTLKTTAGSNDITDMRLDVKGRVYIKGDIETCFIKGCPSGDNRINLDCNALDSGNSTVLVTGNTCRGEISFKNSSVLHTLRICGAPRCTVTLGTGLSSLDTIEMDSGLVYCSSAVATAINVSGGTYYQLEGANSTAANVRRDGTLNWESIGDPGTFNLFNGTINMGKSLAGNTSVQVALNMYNGLYTEASSGNVIGTYNLFGGTTRFESGFAPTKS